MPNYQTVLERYNDGAYDTSIGGMLLEVVSLRVDYAVALARVARLEAELRDARDALCVVGNVYCEWCGNVLSATDGVHQPHCRKYMALVNIGAALEVEP